MNVLIGCPKVALCRIASEIEETEAKGITSSSLAIYHRDLKVACRYLSSKFYKRMKVGISWLVDMSSKVYKRMKFGMSS